MDITKAAGVRLWASKIRAEEKRHETKMAELYENFAINFLVDLRQYITENNLDFSGLGLKIVAGMGTQALSTMDNKDAADAYETYLRAGNEEDDWSDPRVVFCREVHDLMHGNPETWRMTTFNGQPIIVGNVCSANWEWTQYLDDKVLAEKGG